MNAAPSSPMGKTLSLPVAVLGATSHIARDFIRTAHEAHGLDFALYARRPEAVAEFVATHELPRHWSIANLADFPADDRGHTSEFGGIFDFIGFGDPAKAQGMGATIFSATFNSDQQALNYIQRHPEIPYIFMSSGAVYGDYRAPVTAESVALVPINSLTP